MPATHVEAIQKLNAEITALEQRTKIARERRRRLLDSIDREYAAPFIPTDSLDQELAEPEIIDAPDTSDSAAYMDKAERDLDESADTLAAAAYESALRRDRGAA